MRGDMNNALHLTEPKYAEYEGEEGRKDNKQQGSSGGSDPCLDAKSQDNARRRSPQSKHTKQAIYCLERLTSKRAVLVERRGNPFGRTLITSSTTTREPIEEKIC